MGEGPRPAKRGAQGPAPARKNRLWDSSVSRKAHVLTVTCAHTGAVLSAKDATQEQLGHYLGVRTSQLLAKAAEWNVDLSTSRGRRWLARSGQGKHEAWVRKVCPSR